VSADVVFDCTGSAPSLARSTSPLIRGLLKDGLVTVDPSGLGIRAEPTGEVLGSDGGGASIFAVGPLLRGLTYEATAIRELRVQAERTAAAVLRRLSVSSRPFVAGARPK
jgi:uncharacterized NAD(P)/FAD-binding protein YdhS